jgi:asparagine synthase (glutamine-hydrolysing)
MSVQFGTWAMEGPLPTLGYLDRVNSILARYGPDGSRSYLEGSLNILYHSFCTTQESRRETQPLRCRSGFVITWDGRLDNREELVHGLHGVLDPNPSDAGIAAAAFETWGVDCFAKFVGDWAISICKPTSRSLILAKDTIGVRPLYYTFDERQLTWCTLLDPLVLFAGKSFALCEQYIAEWFSCMRPSPDLTPFIGILGVPPSSYVLLEARRGGIKRKICKYWDFDPGKCIRYHSDGEFEEHFRTVFAQAVRRRLRSDKPVLAELSGGMDSSSIVCVADVVTARGDAETPRLDTISYFNDSIPALDEHRYFTAVEEWRNRTGCHIELRRGTQGIRQEVAASNSFAAPSNAGLALTPYAAASNRELIRHYAEHMESGGHRVLLSGIGGDEVTGGGGLTIVPELQNLIARARFIKLVRQLDAWARRIERPPLPLLWESLRGFFPVTRAHRLSHTRPAPWFDSGFARRNRTALCFYLDKVKLLGPLPSFQHNIGLLAGLRREVAAKVPDPEMPCEFRYPFLDRDLLEFLFAVPREQIVGVGKRRYLIKRSLQGIVPDLILTRKRTISSFRPQGSNELLGCLDGQSALISSAAGIIDANQFSKALRETPCSERLVIESLRSTLFLESWLRSLVEGGILTRPSLAERRAVALSLGDSRDLRAR